MRKIVLASNNQHKIKEFKEIFCNDEILSLNDIWYKDEIIEDWKTFLDNALIKCNAVYRFLKEKWIDANIIADDSWLCVNTLNWEPGVYSARYSWLHWDDAANRAKLLKNLEWKGDRSAYFLCCIVEMFPNWKYIYSEWKTYWTILEEEIGDKSFWYDCIFLSDDLHKSFWEASDKEKNRVSHRWRAISNLIEKENNDG
jgi:XTP/dITP diphosphohydrolase